MPPASAVEGVSEQKLTIAAIDLRQEGARKTHKAIYAGHSTCACGTCPDQCIDYMAINMTKPAHTHTPTLQAAFFLCLDAPLSVAHPAWDDLQVGCGELPSSGKGGPCASRVFSAFGSSAPIRLSSRSSKPCSCSSSFLTCLGACGAAFSCRPPSSGQALSASAPSF